MLKLSFKLENIIAIAIAWAFLAFFFDLLFHNPLPNETLPLWSDVGIVFFEETALFGSSWLCLKNWFYPRLLSDRRIWLLFAIGLILQLVANLIYAYWKLVLYRSPTVSLADPFYFSSYLALVLGTVLAVRYRGINLSTGQISILSGVAGLSVWLAWIDSRPLATDNTPSNVSGVVTLAPEWVLAIERTLKPIVGFINLSLVLADAILIVLAVSLLLTFWGGRFSRTWMAIAAGSFLLYIADTSYAIVAARTGSEPIGVIDCLWIVSFLLFGIGAAFEYDASNRLPQLPARINARNRRQ
jgi:hypothetical protein